TRAELEGLIGFFANTLPLRTRLEGRPAFTEVLQRVREVALGAYAHQELPFEILVAELAPARHLSYAPPVQALFSLEQGAERPLDLTPPRPAPSAPEPDALAALLRGVDRAWAKFDLVLVMGERAGQLHGLLEYARDLFRPDSVARLAAHYQTLL